MVKWDYRPRRKPSCREPVAVPKQQLSIGEIRVDSSCQCVHANVLFDGTSKYQRCQASGTWELRDSDVVASHSLPSLRRFSLASVIFSSSRISPLDVSADCRYNTWVGLISDKNYCPLIRLKRLSAGFHVYGSRITAQAGRCLCRWTKPF